MSNRFTERAQRVILIAQGRRPKSKRHEWRFGNFGLFGDGRELVSAPAGWAMMEGFHV